MFLPIKETTFGIVLLVSLTLAQSGHTTKITAMDRAFRDEIMKLPKTSQLGRNNGVIETQVTFNLYTRRNLKGQELKIDGISLRQSTFNLNRPTKFVVHGFFADGESKMMQATKDNILRIEDANVILVDWGKLAKGLNYLAVAQQTRNVGQYLGQLMDFLVRHGSNRRTFHVIGHSLGAHVAGYAGASMRTGKPGRITGLDPAKPEFHKVSPDRRLDPSDADFVDIIHTCGGLLGLMEPIGHADFYPNGGTNVQPGCSSIDFGKCSHSRAHQFFTESIIPRHIFSSQVCTAVDKLKNGCRGSNIRMGYHTDLRARGIYFTTTKDQPPYAPVIMK